MKITGLKKFDKKTDEEKSRHNELLIKSNLALNIVSKELVRLSTIMYTSAMITSYIGNLIALITNNKDALKSPNISQSILEMLIDSLDVASEKGENLESENNPEQDNFVGLSK
ncbi:MAG: hypothetical protein K2J20_02280 [Bacilli bacterium]|nr:hypothetical protein [Bacilli bacterium]